MTEAKSDSFDILVIEDEPVVLSAIRRILESEQLTMDEAASSEIALRKLDKNTYKLIISDLMLPRISGLNLIQLIKGNHPCIPLIVITGYATLEKALESFKIGSFDFIPKPFDTEVFLGVVRRGLNFSRLMEKKRPDQRTFIHIPQNTVQERGPGSLYCLGCHAWVKFDEEGKAFVGAGETFSNMMKDLSRVEILASREEIHQGKWCAKFVTLEGLVNMFWAPLSGIVEAYNEALDRNIHLINEDPYGQGWIFRITPIDFRQEIKHLTRCKRRSNGV